MRTLVRGIVRLCFLVANVIAMLAFLAMVTSYAVGMTILFGPAKPLTVFIKAMLLVLASLVVHEAGHLVAAWVAGLSVQVFAIGPLKIVREGPVFRVRFNNPLSTPAAWVKAMPIGLHDLRRRMATFVAGGPVASFLAVGVCFALAALVEMSAIAETPSTQDEIGRLLLPFMPRTPAVGWLQLAGMLNLLIALGSLTPRRRSGWATDGAQLATWLWGGLPAEVSKILLTLTATLARGGRPRDWDTGLVAGLLERRTGTAADAGANLYGYYHALDTGQFDRAGELLQLALRQSHPEYFDGAICLEAAFYEGLYRRNAAAARAWLQRAPAHAAQKQTRLRAEAAVLLAEGRWEEASAKVEAGLAATADSEDPGGAIAEADWLRLVNDACRKGQKDVSAAP
jgi:hypothetical protein